MDDPSGPGTSSGDPELRGTHTSRRGFLGLCLALVLAGCLDDDPELLGSGEIDVVVDGEPVDLSADRFQAEHADDHAMAFHLHEFDDQWYMEGERRVTVEEALDHLPELSFRVEDEGAVLSLDGDTYDAREDGVSIEVMVNGESVPPSEYTLEDGDHLRVEVGTGEPGRFDG